MDPTRCSSVVKLCGVVGYLRRAVKKWFATLPAKWEAVLTVKELEAAQKGDTFSVTTLNRLIVGRDEASGLLQCHGRVQAIT